MQPSRACLTGKILSGAWRVAPPALECTETELAAAAPFLLTSGAGPLAWHRVAGSPHSTTPAGQALQAAYRGSAIHNLHYEHRLAQILPALSERGVDCLLIKGLALATLYANPDLRPFGDIDLCVSTQQFSVASQTLAEFEKQNSGVPSVDLQIGVVDLPDRSWNDILNRSRIGPFGQGTVRLLAVEDQLRLLCLHQARHGCWRPLWLCDVAAALEQTGPDFDWEYCLAGDERLTQWARAVIEVAKEILGSRIPAKVPPLGGFAPPLWLRDQVLGNWERGVVGDSHSRDDRSILECLGQPSRLMRALWARWPNPVEALFKTGQLPCCPWHSLLPQAKACWGRFHNLLHRI
jgi:hypothetical protein